MQCIANCISVPVKCTTTTLSALLFNFSWDHSRIAGLGFFLSMMLK